MSRYLVAVCVLLGAAVLAHASAAYTFYEDQFDGTSLNPAWDVWGDGPYAVSGGTLNFTTQQGDFINAYESTYGVPHHLFLITPPAAATQWSAVTRVRYNTPNQDYEQVDLIAFKDHDNSVKVNYQWGSNHYEHVVLSEQNGAVSQTPYVSPGYSDFFWLRMDRDGSTYTAWVSGDTTTNPDLVSWSPLGSQTNPMVDPQIGIGGWNTFSSASGEPAEFDYFRLSIVPEPGTAALALCAVALGLRRRGR
jgi:hypothetical protein